jgi:hypothetical protein
MTGNDGWRWSWRKALVAVLAAAGITAGSGLAIYAASGSFGADTRRVPGGSVGEPPDGSRMGALLDALHGEFVVAEADGYATKLMQVGELTEADGDSVAVRSADGFTRTYAVGPDTIWADVRIGDTVRVVATKSGGGATADTITY